MIYYPEEVEGLRRVTLGGHTESHDPKWWQQLFFSWGQDGTTAHYFVMTLLWLILCQKLFRILRHFWHRASGSPPLCGTCVWSIHICIHRTSQYWMSGIKMFNQRRISSSKASTCWGKPTSVLVSNLKRNEVVKLRKSCWLSSCSFIWQQSTGHD